jgi:drug/metabolite transporter (DMT)-like permease
VAGVSAAPAQQPALGIVLMMAAASCFATMDTTVRYLGAFFSVGLVLSTRNAAHVAIMSLWIATTKDNTFRTANPMFQIARGALLAFSATMTFAALRYMPVAEFTAIVLLTPLATTLLARLVLHERVSAVRWTLVVGGFAGALTVIRPGSGVIGWAALMPLAGAASNAAFQLMTSRYAPRENPFTTNFYTGVMGLAIAIPMLLASGADPLDALAKAPPAHLGALAAIAALGTGGHLLLIMALGKAPASTLMPFQYTQLAVAVLAGFVAFGATPDFWSWIGMAVIVVCGAASAWLNLRDAAARHRIVSVVEADTVAD